MRQLKQWNYLEFFYLLKSFCQNEWIKNILLWFQVRWIQISFHLVYKNYWQPSNQIYSIYVNNRPAIIDDIQCQPTVPVQIICKLVPMTLQIFELIHPNTVPFGIHTLKIGKFISVAMKILNYWENAQEKASIWKMLFNCELIFLRKMLLRKIIILKCSISNRMFLKLKINYTIGNDCVYFREVSTNQSSASTVVSGGSSSTSQHQHQIMPATSPLSQFTTNGEVQKLRTTTPPHNLSNSQTQQRGKFFLFFT